MKATKLLARAGAATAAVMVRRVRQGPMRPRWSLRYEILVEYLREQFARDTPLHISRKVIDAGGDLEARRNRVRFTEVIVAGVEAAWSEAPGHDDRVMLYLHGGGYAFGSYRSHRGLCAELSLRTGLRVLAPNYRLAPEHPCPAAIEDAVAAWRWLLDQGVDPKRAWIGGDSAGGGLTLTTLFALRDAGLPMPAGALLLSPWTDLDVTGETATSNEGVDYLRGGRGLWDWAGQYVGELNRQDPRVSPLYGDFRDLPPMLVFVGDAEVLLDDSLRMVERAKAQGASIQLVVEPDEIHVFPVFADFSPGAEAAFAQIDGWLTQTGHDRP